ncbi:solute carrier organic anion transporter family member 4C1-like [Branchiostoma floridae]|uniref:Solute carrier organic anion transporter family member n=1 Tax=Branchiostoma floridae TaxID=7739 RepID=A0A9J7N4G7_BRAFL|nr:solute carrier organic anion transporter family member 4C1-like [Branchiostoma floridae]
MYSTKSEDQSSTDHVIRGQNGDQSQSSPEKEPLRTDRNEDDQSSEEFEGASYGWWLFRPKFLKFLNSPKGFLVTYCVTNLFMNTMADGIISTTITTIEKRFSLSSSQTGTIPGSFDFSCAAAAILLSSLVKSRRMKLRFISIGVALIGFGAMLYGMPHFLVGPHVYGALKADVCVPQGNSTESECNKEGSLQHYLYFFVFAQVTIGIGAAPLLTFGLDLLEKSAPPNQGGLYLGIMQISKGLAIAVGFLLGGQLLGFYIDVDKADPVPPAGGVSDPRWLGAWWLGFFIMGAALLFMSVIYGGFTQNFFESSVEEIHDTTSMTSSRSRMVLTAIRDISGEVLALGCNVCLMCSIFAFLFNGMVFAGITTYAIKSLEVQFGLPPGRASFMIGATIVPGAVLGAILSGVLMKRWRVGVKGALKMASVFAGVTVMFSTFVLIRCPNMDFAGVTVPYHNRLAPPATPVVVGSAILSNCNRNCTCSTYYNPVCGRNGMTYFSPCHAGCVEHDLQTQTYSTCLCVGSDLAPAVFSSNSTDPDVMPGYCESGCGLLPLMLALNFGWATSLSAVAPIILFVLLRSVEERQRSMALGMTNLVGRLLGTIPGPIMFGALVDRSCLLWGQTCGERGACLLYDTANMSSYLFSATFTCNFLALGCMLVALYGWERKRRDERAVKVKPRPLRLSIVMDMKEVDSTE